MKILEGLFCKKQTEKLEKLEEENKALKQKLEEKQEHINKTNSYYKKKLYALKNPK
jgi:predicted RNase H-like nuclease (RuvC/YqgF family)